MLHTLQELRQARALRDAQRVKALQAVLRDTAEQIGLPFHVSGTVVVPNLSTTQKTVITNILRNVLRDSALKAYERQALRHTVRIVRSNPHTVRSVFQSKAMAQSRMMKKPPCRCAEFASQAEQYGVVLDVDGHVALVPVAMNVGGHGGLRPNDPIPIAGSEARKKAISGITTFCTHLNVLVPPLDTLLPPSLFPELGTLLRQLRRLSKFLASYQYTRIVDKGSGELWGFCSAWVWEKVTEFMINEKFEDTGWTQDQWTRAIGDAVSDMQLERNKHGKLCVLYVLAKAKSRRTGKWVFRGISASPAPVLQQRQLRKGARAFTCMLRMWQAEIRHNFQHTDTQSVSGWLHFVAQKGARAITEVDCKKQFDNIHPRDVTRAFEKATKWLTKKRRWRQQQLHWWIHRDTPKLDRSGVATSEKFWVLTHNHLSAMLNFELLHNNVLQAVGQLWSRKVSIPMGGPFSAQSADLHTLWGVKKNGKRMKDWGNMNLSEDGYIFWTRGTMWFSLAQFRDNVLLATNLSPGTRTTLVQEVCDLLASIWNLEVLCDCVDGGAQSCEGDCLSQSRRALGVHMTVGGGHCCAVTHPSALTDTWGLRYGAPLISPTRARREYLPCILISSLTGTLPWQQTWAAQILSALAWAQLAMLSGYKRMTVMRALHKAVRRVYAASPWWSENTMRAVYSVGHDLPCSRATATAKLVHWLTNKAVWEGDRYTDREIPEDLQPEGYTPAWCMDIALLRKMATVQ